MRPNRRRGWLIGAGIVVAILLAVPLLTYGTISPCGMLKAEAMQRAREEMASGGAGGLEVLGVALGASVIDAAIEGMSPIECIKALGDATIPRRGLTTREHAYLAAMESDLHNLATQQEIHWSGAGRYSDDLAALLMRTSPGVQVRILEADADGWAAEATHTSLADRSCVMYIGEVERIPSTAGGVQAVAGGVPACDE